MALLAPLGLKAFKVFRGPLVPLVLQVLLEAVPVADLLVP